MRESVSGTDILKSLSKRQREIAVLVSAGKSNRAIADDLFISERTVENHIAATYERLGMRSRVELAALMVYLGQSVPVAPTRFIGDRDATGNDTFRLHAVAGVGNLPVQLSSFIGRGPELADVSSLLASKRVVTLTGSGGIGKTRTALEIGRATRALWPGGVSFVDLAEAKNDESIVSALCRALCPSVSGDNEMLAKAIEALNTRAKSLIVVDNCEHIVGKVAAVIKRMLNECEGVTVLATSRRPLEISGEQTYRVPSLEAPPATLWNTLTLDGARRYPSVALFLDRSSAVDHRLEPDLSDVSGICQIVSRLDGIPLAIELAASLCSIMKIPQIVERLSDRFEILVDGRQNALPRQRTLGEMIGWSFELLSPQERLLWCRLAVFNGGFTLDSAESVCADEIVPRKRIFYLLKSLVAQSLLVVEHIGEATRYRFLESTRSYAMLTETFETERNKIAGKHAEWVGLIAQQTNDNYWSEPIQELVQRLRADLDNIRAALDWGLRPGGNVLMTAETIGRLREFWFAAGLQGECRQRAQICLERLDAASEPLVVGMLWLALARVTVANARVAAAEVAASLLAPFNQLRDLAMSYYCKAWGQIQTGQFEDAEMANERSIALYRAAGMQNTRPFAEALNQRGDVLGSIGRRDEARLLYDDAIRIYGLLDDEQGALWTKVSIAEWNFAAGETDAAVHEATEALVVAQSRRALNESAVLLSNRAGYHLAAQRLSEAKSDAMAAILLAGATQLEYTLPISLQHIAAVYACSGDCHRAGLISGYVDAWFQRQQAKREPTERASYDLLCRALRANVSETELSHLLSIGADMTQKQAIATAQGRVLA